MYCWLGISKCFYFFVFAVKTKKETLRNSLPPVLIRKCPACARARTAYFTIEEIQKCTTFPTCYNCVGKVFARLRRVGNLRGPPIRSADRPAPAHHIVAGLLVLLRRRAHRPRPTRSTPPRLAAYKERYLFSVNK